MKELFTPLDFCVMIRSLVDACIYLSIPLEVAPKVQVSRIVELAETEEKKKKKKKKKRDEKRCPSILLLHHTFIPFSSSWISLIGSHGRYILIL